jgi:thiosulfate/3-mercaptopyruvate sulfurtransferase
MTYTTLISTDDLAHHLGEANWMVIDTRFSLQDTEWGWREYLHAHIPGAVYAHLDRDLCAPVVPGVTGRHPLPSMDTAAQTLARLGVGDGFQVVAYDAAGGAMAAARIWWMLQWLGHEAVAVLDGGWSKWLREGRPVSAGEDRRKLGRFIPRPRPELTASAAEVDALRRDPAHRLIDVRAAERYRGEVEPIDPVAGHIPGALSAPYTSNLAPDGTFEPIEMLRKDYLALLDDVPTQRIVFYCGSGVTAAQSVLAVTHAGLGLPRLYPGSWSEWITEPKREVER